jgi:phosphinothricin acetyltransferase
MHTLPAIRPVILADLPAIHAIYSHNVKHGTASWELSPPDENEMLRRMEMILGQGYSYFVADLDGCVVGYSYASSYRPRPGYRYTVENSVYVDLSWQRRGIGRLLLSTLIAACEAQGFRQMIAVIGDSQNTGSIALHRALGFVYIGTMPNIGFKFGRWLDGVLMQRTLGEGATTLPEDKVKG